MPTEAPKTHAEKPEDESIEAILASLRVWILDVIAALFEEFGPRAAPDRATASELRAHLRDVQFDLKRAIFLLAAARVELPALKPSHRPPPGFAVRRFRQSALRLVTHGTFRRMRAGNIRARIARLRDILHNVETWTARLQARLVRGFTGARRILAAPPRARVAPSAPARAAAFADTS